MTFNTGWWASRVRKVILVSSAPYLWQNTLVYMYTNEQWTNYRYVIKSNTIKWKLLCAEVQKIIPIKVNNVVIFVLDRAELPRNPLTVFILSYPQSSEIPDNKSKLQQGHKPHWEKVEVEVGVISSSILYVHSTKPWAQSKNNFVFKIKALAERSPLAFWSSF